MQQLQNFKSDRILITNTDNILLDMVHLITSDHVSIKLCQTATKITSYYKYSKHTQNQIFRPNDKDIYDLVTSFESTTKDTQTKRGI